MKRTEYIKEHVAIETVTESRLQIFGSVYCELAWN
jgi:hypothetical protein